MSNTVRTLSVSLWCQLSVVTSAYTGRCQDTVHNVLGAADKPVAYLQLQQSHFERDSTCAAAQELSTRADYSLMLEALLPHQAEHHFAADLDTSAFKQKFRRPVTPHQ